MLFVSIIVLEFDMFWQKTLNVLFLTKRRSIWYKYI